MDKRGVHDAPRRREERRKFPFTGDDYDTSVERRVPGSIGRNEGAGELHKSAGGKL